MKRSFPSAVLAIAPLVVLLVLGNAASAIDAQFEREVPSSSFAELATVYWWAAVVSVVLLHAACYAVAALRNAALPFWKRVAWVALIMFFVPLGVPLYWWVHSEKDFLHSAA